VQFFFNEKEERQKNMKKFSTKKEREEFLNHKIFRKGKLNIFKFNPGDFSSIY